MKKVYEVAKNQTDHEMKQRLDEVLDALRDIKQQASELEDENRELREKLRFKSDEFEFKNPFWYDKKYPERALCPKCFADQKYAPVSESYQSSSGRWRKCLHCDTAIEESRGQRHIPSPYGNSGYGGPNGWMR